MPPPPRPRSGRLRRAVKWAGTVLLLLLTGVWVLSGWRQVARAQITSNAWCGVERGEATLSYWAHDPAVGLRLGPINAQDAVLEVLNDIANSANSAWWRRARWNWSSPRVWYHSDASDTDIGVMLPLWMMFAALAAPTAYLWHRDRRRFGPGRCARCGYDLEGLGAGAACPECGRVPA